MTIFRAAGLTAILALVAVLLDLVWLGLIAKGFYAQQVGGILRKTDAGLAPRWSAAAAVYLFIAVGLVVFVRPQITAQTSLLHAFGWGACFGFVLYGVYDFTNLAILDRWTWPITIADVAWGSILCGLCACVLWRLRM